jgi:hypothetical protein
MVRNDINACQLLLVADVQCTQKRQLPPIAAHDAEDPLIAGSVVDESCRSRHCIAFPPQSAPRFFTFWEVGMAELGEQLEDLVIANRILAHEGVVDGFGHVSLRHPEGEFPSRLSVTSGSGGSFGDSQCLTKATS